MASTYAPSDAFTYAKTMVKNEPLDDVKISILDDALKMLWHAAPWRWSVGVFSTTTLVANTQDYTVTVPADFLYLQEAYITNENGDSPRHLKVVPVRPAGGSPGQPSEVSLTSTTLRLYPKPGTIKTGDTLKVLATYKKLCPNVTVSNVSVAGTQVFDDDWFWVFKSGVLYHAYQYADDQRAGGATIGSNGSWQFTGQRGVFETNLQLMREREKLPPSTDRLIQEPAQK